VRLEAGFARDRIQDQLDREADAGARHPAIGQDRTLVGGDREGAAAIGREVVGAGQDARDLRRLQAGGERVGRIGARIDRRLALEPEQPAIAVGVRGNHVVMLAAVGVGDQVLAPVLDPAHRMPAAERKPTDADLLRREDALVAETAADVGRDHPHLAVLEAQAVGQAGAHDVRHLGRAVDGELLEAAVPERDHALALDRRHALAGRAQLARHGDRGRCRRRPVARLDESLEEDVVAPVLMQQRRARPAPFEHVMDRGQLLELDDHARRDVLRLGAARGEAHGDQLADLADLAPGQRRLVGDLEARQAGDRRDRLHLGHVVRREDRAPVRIRHPDAADLRMRHRAAREGNLFHPGQADVGDELPAAAHVAVVFLADQPTADAPVPHAPPPDALAATRRARTYQVPIIRTIAPGADPSKLW